METPSSTARRVTRSQTNLAASNNTISSNNISFSKKIEDSEKNLSKTRQRNGQQQQQERCALVDISNDSPIVGLASGDLETPLSSIVKQRGSRVKKTPCSGEALLRGQVKTLLQKVEEEAEISKLSMEIRPFLQLANSPMSLLAPTPANTPQIPNLSNEGGLNNRTGLVSVLPSPLIEEQLIPQVMNQIFDGKNKENPESEKSLITRSLLLDFSDKSEVSECSSVLTSIEKSHGSTEDDAASSIWSIQVKAKTHEEDDEEEEMAEKEDDEEEDYYDEDAEEEEYDDGGLLVDELCAGLNNISVNNERVVAPMFAGKHTRFVYDSDDELVEEVEVECCAEIASNVLRLKGLPTPTGKHLRFPEEEEKSSF
ncbi:uncharacterized protein LOC133296330 [Gastrolobium bilobum]|uniref:uncharacterized protein LOC133296330 n=1 Tax=Gastrolobium bilobum TaxID=150636 RepID=UPI002AB1D313|nr:uncharacterized protein LOC133296330 [Gastrolobium bilobum]